MADRATGEDFTIRAETGDSASPVSVVITDASGETIENDNATYKGDGWWDYAVTGDTSSEGLWTAVWTAPGGTITQSFTVGEPGYLTLHDLRRRVASWTARHTHYGMVSVVSSDSVTDDTLYGGSQDWVGSWLVFDHASHLGQVWRRVIGFNGSTLTVHKPYATSVSAGTRYTLMEDVSPFEIDTAIEEAISTFKHHERPELHVSGLTLDDYSTTTCTGYVDIPLGWEYVHSAHITETDGNERELSADFWEVASGRRIHLLTTDEDATIRLIGQRSPRMPVWEDSTIDLNPGLLVPATAHRLFVARARGSTTDPDDFLRRSMMATELVEQARRDTRGRVASNVRKALR